MKKVLTILICMLFTSAFAFAQPGPQEGGGPGGEHPGRGGQRGGPGGGGPGGGGPGMGNMPGMPGMGRGDGNGPDGNGPGMGGPGGMMSMMHGRLFEKVGGAFRRGDERQDLARERLVAETGARDVGEAFGLGLLQRLHREALDAMPLLARHELPTPAVNSQYR